MAFAIDTLTIEHDVLMEALEHIAQGLRPADKAELEAAGATQEPFWLLFESWEASTLSWLIVDATGLPIGIMGVAPHVTPGLGIAWMMGTEGVEREALSIARQTRRYVAAMHELYPVLFANVDARNALSMKWLEWSGFRITDANPSFGPEERLFLHYTRTV